MRVAPTSMAAMELATPMARLWWPWKPSSVSGLSASRTAERRPSRRRQQVAGGVGDVDAVGAVASISLACLTSPSGCSCGHHQKADGVHLPACAARP